MEQEYTQHIVPVEGYPLETYDDLMRFLEGKLLTVNGAVVVSVEVWNTVMTVIKRIDNNVKVLRDKTPVEKAGHVCQVTGCQWEQLSANRHEHQIRKKSWDELVRLVDDVLSMLTKMKEKELVLVEDWWEKSQVELNRRVEDIKRVIV